MCEIIDITNVPEGGFTAKEDILCYKVLGETPGRGYVSPFRPGSSWRPDGRPCRTEMLTGGPGCIESVFYCEDRKAWIREVYNHADIEDQRQYMENVYTERFTLRLMESHAWSAGGFHTFSRYMNNRMEDMADHLYAIMDNVGWNSLAVARCTIPAGSRYYVSDDGMAYVSDALAVDCIVSRFTV